MEDEYVICRECGEVFSQADIKRVRHSDGDAWDECPYCGSDELDDVEQCVVCGRWVAPEDIYHGVCKDCLMDKAEDARLVCEFGAEYKQPVKVNAIYEKAFSDTQIDMILQKAFVNLLYNEIEQAAYSVATDDLDAFAEWLVKEEQI